MAVISQHTPQIWRLPTVLQAVGLSRSSIYDMMQKGTFPKAVKLGPRAIGWNSHEVQAWIEARLTGMEG